MFDDINKYFYEEVLANYKEFVKSIHKPEAGNNNDLRLALNVAIPLYHMREHLPEAMRKKQHDYEEICTDYKLLADIVNISKHKKINKNKPRISSAAQIYELIIVTEYIDEKGPYRIVSKKVMVKLDDNTERDVNEIFINILNMWIKEFKSNNITDYNYFSIPDETIIPKRNDESESARFNLVITKGLNFKQVYQFRKYDYNKKKPIPIDITGTEFQFNIYKPKFNIFFTAKNNLTGAEKSIEVELTEKQNQKLMRLKKNTTKEKYLNQILNKSEEFKFFINETKKTSILDSGNHGNYATSGPGNNGNEGNAGTSGPGNNGNEGNAGTSGPGNNGNTGIADTSGTGKL